MQTIKGSGYKTEQFEHYPESSWGRGGLGRFKESRFMIRFMFWGRLIWQVLWRQMGEPEALLMIEEGLDEGSGIEEEDMDFLRY